MMKNSRTLRILEASGSMINNKENDFKKRKKENKENQSQESGLNTLKRKKENKENQSQENGLNTPQYVELYDQGNWERLQELLNHPKKRETSGITRKVLGVIPTIPNIVKNPATPQIDPVKDNNNNTSESPPGLSPSQISSLEVLLSYSNVNINLSSSTTSHELPSSTTSHELPSSTSSSSSLTSSTDEQPLLIDINNTPVIFLDDGQSTTCLSSNNKVPLKSSSAKSLFPDENNLQNFSEPVMTGIVPLDDGVIKKKRYDRKNYCIFCDTLVLKLRRHMMNNHSNEQIIKEYIGLYECDAIATKKKRNKIMADLTLKGNHYFNKQLIDMGGVSGSDLLPVRRPPVKVVMKPHEYVTCTICHGLFVRKHFYQHASTCKRKNEEESVEYLENIEVTSEKDEDGERLVENTENNENPVESKSNIVIDCFKPKTMFVKEYGITFCPSAKGAAEGLVKNILPILRKDEIGRKAMTDNLLMSVVSDFYSSHTENKDKTQVTRKLRDGTRLVLQVNKLDPTVNSLKDIFNPSKCKTVITACQQLCKLELSKPSDSKTIVGMNLRLSWVIEEGGKRLIDDIICDITLTDDQKKTQKSLVRNFLDVMRRRWKYYISTNTEKMRRRLKILKDFVMPADEDIIKLAAMLREYEIKLHKELSEHITQKAYEMLCKVTISHILTLNRRRPFEATHSEIDLYLKKKTTNYFSQQILESLASEERLSLQELSSYIVPAKGIEAVATILLTKNMEKSIDIIINCRKHFGMEDSELLFPRPGLNTTFDGSKVLKEMVSLCPDLINPKHLTSNGLRHHVATLGHVKGPGFSSQLSQFMCHTDAVHNKNYVAPIPMVHRAVIGNYLTTLEGTSLQKDSLQLETLQEEFAQENKTIEDASCLSEELNDPTFVPSDESDCESVINKYKNNKFDKPEKPLNAKSPWTDKEKVLVVQKFKNYLLTKTAPGIIRSRQLIEESGGVLSHRKPVQINAFIHNINKGRLKLPHFCSHLLTEQEKMSLL